MKATLFITLSLLLFTPAFGQTYNLSELQQLLHGTPKNLEKKLLGNSYTAFAKRDFKDFVIAQYGYFTDKNGGPQIRAFEVYFRNNNIFQIEYSVKSKAEFNVLANEVVKKGFVFEKSGYDELQRKNTYYKKGLEQIILKEDMTKFPLYNLYFIKTRDRKLYGRNIPRFH